MSGTDEPLTPQPRGRRDWIVPAILGSALLMQTLNANVITNALPAMAATFGVEPLRLNLAITVYLLTAAVCMPVSGWVADRFGAKRILMLAMALYALSSALCGLAQDLPQLIGARVLQGAAGAMMVPVGRLVLLRTTPRSELVSAMAVLTMPAMFGPVVGPLLGGAIVTFADWRWIFFLNLPIAVAGLLLVRRFVPNVKEQEVSPLDWTGIMLTGVGLAALIFGFESLGHAAAPGVVGALFLTGAASLALYWRHARGNPHAIIDLSIFRLPTFQASVVGGGFFRVALGANPFLLAMLLQVGFGLSAFAAGSMTFATAVGALLMKGTAPPILRRFGFRNVLLANGAIVALSLLVCSAFRPTTPHWIIIGVLSLSGFFRSLQFSSLNTLAFADIAQDRMSRASVTSAMVQQLVQSVGIGLAAALLQLLMVLRHETALSWQSVAPAFAITAAASLISIPWFLRLSRTAGDEMSGRGRD